MSNVFVYIVDVVKIGVWRKHYPLFVVDASAYQRRVDLDLSFTFEPSLCGHPYYHTIFGIPFLPKHEVTLTLKSKCPNMK